MNLKQLLLLIVLIISTCLLSFSLVAQVPTSGLVAYWPMNGNLTDAGPNGIHGSLVGGASATTNRFGAANTAISFNNLSTTVSQIATHPVHASLNFGNAQDFTISTSFFLTSPWVHAGGIYENNMNYFGYGVWIWQSGGPTDYRVQFNFKNNSVASTPLPLNTWIHLVALRSGNTLQIYINGVLNAAGVVGGQTPSYSFPGRFGTMFFNGQSPQNYNGLYGKVDETRIYNRALTLTEIVQLNAVVLPTKMGDFTAIKKTNGIELNWETLTEANVSDFGIERSNDGNNFSPIGRVNAAGNSNNKSTYTYLDANPLSSTNYYRLKMIDLDGSFMYSRVLVIKNEELITLSIFPNPVSTTLQVQLPSSSRQTVNLFITDMGGHTLYNKQMELNKGINAASIPVQQLPAGMYCLYIRSEQGIESRKFTKQ